MNNYENFDNMETNSRKSALIQERVNLVSSHMYKQFLDYSHATLNTNKIFANMNENLIAIVETLKEGFSSRGVTTQNIYVDTDPQKSVIIVNILWHKMSFTTRCNFQPQALYREAPFLLRKKEPRARNGRRSRAFPSRGAVRVKDLSSPSSGR